MKIINSSSRTASVSLAGGKGFSLFKLSKSGFNVPEFFIVTTQFFEEYLAVNNLKSTIDNLYKRNQFEDIEKLILNGKFSSLQQREIESNLKRLKGNKFSVRSSCTFEDSAEKSCAGQLKTFLNVKRDGITRNIKKCFASFYTKNLKDYVMGQETGSMAVVVQTMVDCDYSGVCFSTDYINQNKDFCIIEVAKGLGDNLVSGKVTPTKFIIRKDSGFLEKKIGRTAGLEKVVENLSQKAQEIERLYKMPMDIEWGLKNNRLYFLQARPIVGKMDITIDYDFVMSRPRPLFLMQIVQSQSFQGLSWFLDGKYFFKPVHLFIDGHFEEYTNMFSIKEDPDCMIKYLSSSCKNINNKLEIAYECAKYVEGMVSGKVRFNIDELIQCFIKFGANNTIANLIENTTNISKIDSKLNKTLKSKIINHREYFDNVKYKADDFLTHYVKMSLPRPYLRYINVMTLDEVFKNKPVSTKVLEKRLQGFAYFDGKIILKDEYDAFFKDNFMNIKIRKFQQLKPQECISGSIAYSGIVRGRVKILYSEEDMQKVNKGDIIVSTMTVPTYIMAMKKAGEIVTDEGGTVCHAALISRELKKPCIVGTKCATLLLSDDMLVELDANNGKVYIIKE